MMPEPDRFDLAAAIKLAALPRVSIRLCFNESDEGFPAQCIHLFHQSCEIYLNMQSNAVIGAWLAGNPITPGNCRSKSNQKKS